MDKVRGFPKRDFMDDPNTVWRNGVPNYDDVNKSFIEGRTKIHEENSLENTVQNLVKSWEMELTHKIRVQDWQTVDRKLFTISANGGKRLSLQEYMESGNYNALLNDCPYYDASTETLKSSTETFQNAFKSGFPWEVLEVYSGPPVVAFSWRHWGKFEGSYKEESPTDETIELFGCSVARVNDELKIVSVDVFLDANPMMKKLTGGKMCPFAK